MKKETQAGRVITDPTALARELRHKPSIYYRGKPRPTAFIVGMPYRTVIEGLTNGWFQRCVKPRPAAKVAA